jgi:AcrR family transcriptional regulator
MTTAKIRPNYHHGDLESALLITARKFVKKNGVESLSLRQIAHEIGVSPSAAYHYYPDRNSLLAALGFSLFEELADYQERELAKISGSGSKSVRDRYRTLGRTYFEWAIREPHFFNLMFSDICLLDKTYEKKLEDSRAYVNLNRCLDELVSVGLLDKKFRVNTELLSWAIVHGATSLIVSGHLQPEDYEKILDSLDLLLGIRKWKLMSDLFPSSTEDERDPREDQSDSKKREDEIKGDKPPHHDE